MRFWALVCGLLLMAGCSNPRQTNTPTPDGNEPATNAPANNAATPDDRPRDQTVTLRQQRKQDEAIRMRRFLRVEELTEQGRVTTESEEIVLSRIERVDESGRPLVVLKSWEESVTRLARGDSKPEVAQGALRGCTLRLTRRVGRIDTEVVLGDVNIGGARFVIDGLDAGLLPVDPMTEGANWRLGADALRGLSNMLATTGLEIEKNTLRCALDTVTDDRAEIAVSWSLSGMLNKVPAVFEFTGRVVFDRKQKLVTRFKLSGGSGDSRRIEMDVTRRVTDGWLDLTD